MRWCSNLACYLASSISRHLSHLKYDFVADTVHAITWFANELAETAEPKHHAIDQYNYTDAARVL